MAATGNEVPLLSQLKKLKNWISGELVKKADANNNGIIDLKSSYYRYTGSSGIVTGSADPNAEYQYDNSATNARKLPVLLVHAGDSATNGNPYPAVLVDDDIFQISHTSNGSKQFDARLTMQNANAGARGLMSAADKRKLDGLPASITEPAVDIVKVTEHSTSYTKDTLEIVCDDTGKVTAMYFVSV